MNRTVPTALCFLAFAACSGRAEKAALPPASGAPARAVRVARPAARMETGLSRATGSVRSRDEATLSARATGQIRAVHVQVGERVRKGQALVQMDDASARIALAGARASERLAAASLAAAERDLARAVTLRGEEGMSQATAERVQTARDIAAAQLDQARAALLGAEQQVSDMVIRAPFDGAVTARWHGAGDTVTLMPVTPIVGLSDVDHLEVRLQVPESLDAFVCDGSVLDGQTTIGGQRFQARVRARGPSIDLSSRTVEVLADVVSSDGPLKPGSIVTVDLGARGQDGELFLPSSAVQGEGTATWVLVLSGDKAERRDVKVTRVNPGTVAVAGLPPDALVVIDPGALASGDAVVPLAD
jgi:RND family efflux transporter MFP subunit